MNHFVTTETFETVLTDIATSQVIAVDTETTGLFPYHGDRLFAIVVATKNDCYYFDFSLGYLPKSFIKRIGDSLNSEGYAVFVNYDYDLSMLAVDEISVVSRKIIDVPVLARLDFSFHPNSFLSLDYLAKFYLGEEKDTTVLNHIKEHGLYGQDPWGNKKPLYNAVNKDIMFKYACKDARLTYDLFVKINRSLNDKSINPELIKTETQLSRALFEIKQRGILADYEYIEKAYIHERNTHDNIVSQLPVSINSPKQIAAALEEDGVILPKTKKGNPSATAAVLENLNHPLAKKIITAKKAHKKFNTYYANYLKLCDSNEVIHAQLNQAATVTGRLSSSNPNLQNLAKEEHHKWAVRNSFIARPEYRLFMLDYKQQEMVIMADLAGEESVIDKMKSGLDFYEATAETIKQFTGIEIDRATAKMTSLALAYGQGIKLMASNLNMSESQAKRVKETYFRGLPKLKELQRSVEREAKIRGYIINPFGRRTYIEKGYEYKALNALIQGTAADVTKRAILDCHEFVKDYESKVVLCVHDEIIFEVKEGEERLISPLKKLMIDAYPFRYIPLDVDVEFSSTSWAAKTDYPTSLT